MATRPSAGEFKHSCPELPISFIEEYLGSFGRRYFDTFTETDLWAHARALARLDDQTLCTIRAEELADGANQLTVTVIGVNFTGIFAAITGLLSAAGFDINSGAIFTSEPKGGAVAGGRRRFIVDLFTGALSPERGVQEWQEELSVTLSQVYALYARGDADSIVAAKHIIYENVVQALADVDDQASFLYPIEITVDESVREYTRLRVVSEDTPFFLFSLSNSLAMHGVSIEQVSIRTVNSRIEDEIDFVDDHGSAVTDPQILNQIKLSVLVTKQFTYFLGKAPDPYAALTRFEEIAQEILGTPSEESWHRLLSSPRILEDLARMLGTSDFLWEDFIRGQYESILPMLSPSFKKESLSHAEEELESLLSEKLSTAATLDEKRAVLNSFKDNEIYLIDLDHLVTPGMDFLFLSHKLTSLAEVVIRCALRITWEEMARSYGVPRTFGGLPAEYAILGLGKFGGQALGYASDIELLFVYSDSGETDGKKSIANREFFEYLFRDAVNMVEAKREGIFHVDLRLRPYGKNSPLATSLDAFCRYYGPGGDAHSLEKLALVRMRAVGGDREFGRRVERLRDEMIYSSESIDLAELRDARERQLKEKTQAGRSNAKFSPGALVDLEYSVQIIQSMYGKDNPKLRTPRIHAALDELVEAGHLSGDEAKDLVEAYHFLRKLINGLRVLRGSAQDLFLPPDGSEEYTHLARRTGYSKQFGLSPAELLHLEFETRTASVRSFVERHLGRDSLPGPPVGNAADLVLSDAIPIELRNRILAEGGFSNTERAYRNLKSLAGSDKRRSIFARLAVLSWDIIRATPDPDMAVNNWERLVGGVDPIAHFNRLLAQPRRIDILLAILAGSQFLADTVIREPELLNWVSAPGILNRVRSREAMRTDLNALSDDSADKYAWRAALRRFRRREIMRIGTRDICLGVPMREIVTELSNLADVIVGSVVNRAWSALCPDRSLADAGFCVLAFGKLGGQELNYSSDLDLLGIVGHDAADASSERDAASSATLLETLRSDLSDYTAEGFVYRVDFRLRPYGSSGPLVQPLPALMTYYRNSASLWEYQALLKLRPVAGDLASGERFLEMIRPFIVKTWNRAEISQSIARLRSIAEKQVSSQATTMGSDSIDVKSGAGGIRDIEFLVQGLQLSEGARRPEILTGNTIRGIELLAESGLLGPEIARQLGEDYLYLRRVEHLLQLFEDRQVHALPDDPAARTALARRIDGRDSTAEQFLEKLSVIRARVRDQYEQFLQSMLDDP